MVGRESSKLSQVRHAAFFNAALEKATSLVLKQARNRTPGPHMRRWKRVHLPIELIMMVIDFIAENDTATLLSLRRVNFTFSEIVTRRIFSTFKVDSDDKALCRRLQNLPAVERQFKNLSTLRIHSSAFLPRCRCPLEFFQRDITVSPPVIGDWRGIPWLHCLEPHTSMANLVLKLCYLFGTIRAHEQTTTLGGLYFNTLQLDLGEEYLSKELQMETYVNILQFICGISIMFFQKIPWIGRFECPQTVEIWACAQLLHTADYRGHWLGGDFYSEMWSESQLLERLLQAGDSCFDPETHLSSTFSWTNIFTTYGYPIDPCYLYVTDEQIGELLNPRRPNATEKGRPYEEGDEGRSSWIDSLPLNSTNSGKASYSRGRQFQDFLYKLTFRRK